MKGDSRYGYQGIIARRFRSRGSRADGAPGLGAAGLAASRACAIVGSIRVAATRIGEKRQRIQDAAVDANLVMEVWTRGAAGRADDANLLAAPNVLSGLDTKRGQVTIARLESVAMIEHDQ